MSERNGSAHPSEVELNEWTDGALEPSREAEVRSHLEGCERCAARAERLAGLLEELGGLPVRASAPRDLWDGIRARMTVPDEATGVRALHRARSERTAMGRRVSLSLSQLLAAGIVLAFLSGGGVWLALSGGDGPARGEVPAALRGPSVMRTAATRGALADYEAAATDLETVLEEGREHLRPETLRVLAENLLTVDQAVQEAREALAENPGSEVLYRLLQKNMRRKLDLLRSAAQAVTAAS